MTPEDLLARIVKWEDLHTEFKRGDLPDRHELAKDIVCFANTDGGQLIFGVSEDREVIGVADVTRLVDLVDNVSYDLCRPPVTVVPEVLDVGGRTVVVLNIAKGDQRPYSTSQGRYYLRSGQRCRQASREELLRLFQATESFFWDEQPVQRAKKTDLDERAIERYLANLGREELINDLELLLRNWRLTDGERPTVAGMVLFGRDPQLFLPSAGVVVAAYGGTDTSEDPIDLSELHGGLFDVIRDIERFLDVHVATPHRIIGFEDERRETIPWEALREAVINALVHRDYTISGPVRIFALSDRVEVHTPGSPPNSVDASAMRAGVHVTRNPYIYARVADAGLVTKVGTGVPRMIRLVREASGKEVGLDVTGSEVVVVLPKAGRP